MQPSWEKLVQFFRMSGVYSLWQGLQERRDQQLATIVNFESQFSGTR